MCNCGSSPCHCAKRSAVKQEVFSYTLTQKRALRLVSALLSQNQCKPTQSSADLLDLFDLECELKRGRAPLAILALLVAARIVQSGAIQHAAAGNVKTMAVTLSGATNANALMQIANRWVADAELALSRMYPAVAIVRTGTSCISACKPLYSHYGCNHEAIDTKVVSCNYGCADDC